MTMRSLVPFLRDMAQYLQKRLASSLQFFVLPAVFSTTQILCTAHLLSCVSVALSKIAHRKRKYLSYIHNAR